MTAARRGAGLEVVVAAVLDHVVGEPPATMHPVVGIGRLLTALEARLLAGSRARGPAQQRFDGLVALGLGGLAVLAVATAATRLANAPRRSPGSGPAVTIEAVPTEAVTTEAVPTETLRGALLGGVLLKPAFALRMLLDEVSAVADALDADDLPGARAAVGRLVSRDVTTLDAHGVAMAAIETLAENLSDSVVAPLCWYAVGGLPAAALYRYANTADAMWGYREPPWTHRGWAAARLDDLANLVPARTTAVALLAAPAVAPVRTVPSTGRAHHGPGPGRSRSVRRGQVIRTIAALRREASRTASPNAGWSMAAMALRLDVALEKVGHYVLHAGGRPPTADDVRRAVRVAATVGRLALLVAALLVRWSPHRRALR